MFPLAVDDPLANEWTVVVSSPYVSAALIARDVGDSGPDMERRFDYILTHDPDIVQAAGEVLLRRTPTFPAAP